MTSPRLDVWPPLPVGVYARRPAGNLPFPLADPGCTLFQCGRHALWHGLGIVGLRAGDEVLVPAYHHGSEIEVMVRRGLRFRFYDATDDLAPDEAELGALLGLRTRALYLIHYLGFPQDAARWRHWCDERGLLLIEDAAQAWLASLAGRPLGSFGDIAIFCLYKTFGVPDGGALLTRSPDAPADAVVPADSSGGLGAGRLARRHVAWLAQQSGRLAGLVSKLERPGPYSAERDFALGDPDARPSTVTVRLLSRIDPETAAHRRLNYRLLLDEIGDLAPRPFDALAPGASPFAFPVTAASKPSTLARLADHGVRALDFWSVPHPALPAAEFPGAAQRRSQLVALPVHQELEAGHIKRIAGGVRAQRRLGAEVRLEPLDSIEAARSEWSELAARSRNIFGTWEWISTWIDHFGGARQPRAFCCRAPDGRPLAILPLYLFSSRPLRVLRFLGHGPSDHLGPVCAPSDHWLAARQLERLLFELRPDWDVFVGEHLPGDEGWERLLGGRVLRREGSPILRSSGGWDEYLATRSPNFRQGLRRAERKLAREHELNYRLAEDPARLDADLDILFTLHAARWDRRESSFAGSDMEFHRAFAKQALERGWLRLWLLELDGEPRAAWYGFRFEGVESYYQAGRDPAWREQSIGLVLLAHTVRAALDDGIEEYRFLRGGEPFKYRFTDLDPGLVTVAVADGPGGEAALTAGRLIGTRWLAGAARRLIG